MWCVTLTTPEGYLSWFLERLRLGLGALGPKFDCYHVCDVAKSLFPWLSVLFF